MTIVSSGRQRSAKKWRTSPCRKALLRAGLAAVAFAVPAAAQAATYLITFTGTVSNSLDQTGEFGAANSSLDGLAFTSVYTLTIPTSGAITSADPFTQRIYGGLVYGPSVGNPVTAKLTINGITQNFGTINHWAGSDSQSNFPDYDAISLFSQDFNYNGNQYSERRLSNIVQSGVNNIVDTNDYTSPLYYILQAGDDGHTQSQFYLSSFHQGNTSLFAYGDLTAQTVRIALAPNPGGVPEPASWALMLGGFGIAGAALRRTRALTAEPA